MNSNPDNVKLIKNNRSLLRIRLKETSKRYNSHKGEVEIFIHAAKKMHFDRACLQTKKGRVFCESTVNNISWHGFFDNSKNKVKLPVINFKKNDKKVWCPRHKGVIQQKDVFLFPICNAYFPSNINISTLSVIKKNTNSYEVKMDNRSNIRADFFVLPRDISLKQFMNTLFIAIPSTIIPILIASFAAYAFTWMEFPGRKLIFIFLVGLLVIPLQMTMIPILRIFSNLGIVGTFPGIWLAHTGYGLPSELFDSSSIDGATPFQIFIKIVMPLSVPALASVTIFQFLWVWNDLLVALVYLGGTPDVAPLTVCISALVGSYGQDWELLTAAAFVSMILPLVLFLGLQRYFVKGILAGSVKG